MVLVHYLVLAPDYAAGGEAGALPVSGSLEVIATASAPSLADVKRCWPFEGRFHWRARVKKRSEAGDAWLDLSQAAEEADKPLPVFNGAVQLKVLPLWDEAEAGRADASVAAWGARSAPAVAALSDAELEAVGEDWSDHYERLAAAPGPAFDISETPVTNPASTDGVQRIRGGSGGPTGGDGVEGAAGAGGGLMGKLRPGRTGWGAMKGVGKLLGSAAKAAAGAANAAAEAAAGAAEAAAGAAKAAVGGHGAGRVPSMEALVNLQAAQVDFQTAFRPEFPPHEELLARLWALAVSADAELVRVSPRWRAIGFQQDDPGTDFRGGGVLSLRCLVYFAEQYPDALAAIVAAQAPRKEGNYPVAAAGINVAHSLALLLGLDKPTLGEVAEPYWEVFKEYNAFFELFCLAFRLFNALWLERGARYSQFGDVLADVRARVEALLARGPASLAQLMDFAMTAGVLR